MIYNPMNSANATLLCLLGTDRGWRLQGALCLTLFPCCTTVAAATSSAIMKGHRSAGPSLEPATFAQPGTADSDVTTLPPSPALVYLLGAGLMANLLVDLKSLTRVLFSFFLSLPGSVWLWLMHSTM